MCDKFILITCLLDSLWILHGEVTSPSPLGVKGLKRWESLVFPPQEVVFKQPGFSLLKVVVMTIGEVDFEDRFMHSQNITNKPTSSQTASFVFLGLFLILMTIVLMNLLVCIKIRNFSVTFNSTSRMHKCKSTSVLSQTQ